MVHRLVSCDVIMIVYSLSLSFFDSRMSASTRRDLLHGMALHLTYTGLFQDPEAANPAGAVESRE